MSMSVSVATGYHNGGSLAREKNLVSNAHTAAKLGMSFNLVPVIQRHTLRNDIKPKNMRPTPNDLRNLTLNHWYVTFV
jgi:hypothetical protein